LLNINSAKNLLKKEHTNIYGKDSPAAQPQVVHLSCREKAAVWKPNQKGLLKNKA